TRMKKECERLYFDTSGQPFYIQDGTGTALVYPHSADCSVHFMVEEECSGMSLPPVYAEFMKAHNASRWRLNRLRFREWILEDTQRVFVMGTAMPTSKAVSISDDELQATGTDGDFEARRRATLDHDISAVIRQGENEKTFIISQDSERDMVTQLGMKAFGGLIG